MKMEMRLTRVNRTLFGSTKHGKTPRRTFNLVRQSKQICFNTGAAINRFMNMYTKHSLHASTYMQRSAIHSHVAICACDGNTHRFWTWPNTLMWTLNVLQLVRTHSLISSNQEREAQTERGKRGKRMASFLIPSSLPEGHRRSLLLSVPFLLTPAIFFIPLSLILHVCALNIVWIPYMIDI